MVTEKEFLEVVMDLAEEQINFTVHYPTADSAVITVTSPALNNTQLEVIHSLGGSFDQGKFRMISYFTK